MSIPVSVTSAGVLLILAFTGTATAPDAEHGKGLFPACAAFYSARPGSLGPNLKGVFGRNSAALDDFRYSNPMKRANLVWDEANLRDYIADPQGKVRGNRRP